MTDLTSVVIGGGIAVVGGLVGAFIQGRREYRKWLREQRLEAYSAVLGVYDRLAYRSNIGMELTDEELSRDLLPLESRADLLGPSSLKAEMRKLRHLLLLPSDQDSLSARANKWWAAQAELVRAAQKALGVPVNKPWVDPGPVGEDKEAPDGSGS